MAGRIYEVALRIGAAINKSFKVDTTAAAKSLTQLRAASTASQAALASAKGRYDGAAEALRRLQGAENAAGGATKESTKWRKAGERAVSQYAREMDRATKAVEKNASAVRNFDLAQFQASKRALFGERSKTPLVQKAGEQFRGVAHDALFLATAAVGATVSMGALVLKALHAGDEIGDTADKLGIGAKALQELRYGARQSGAEVGSLDLGLRRMATSIGKFKAAKAKGGVGAGVVLGGVDMLGTGGETAAGGNADPFKRIGLSAKQLAGLKPEEQLKKIADGMATLKTHDDRAAVAQAIFGKGAADLLPFLGEGAKGIDKLSKQANRFGGVMSDEAVKAADEADKALKDAELAVSGLTNSLGAELLPVATRVFREFSGWVASNRGEIKQWAEGAARWIEGKGIPAIMSAGREAKSFAEKILYVVNAGAKMVGGFGNLAIAVGALRLAPLVLTLSKIGIEGFKAASALFRFALASKESQAAQAAAGGRGGMGAAGVLGIAAAAAAGENAVENAVLSTKASGWQKLLSAVGFKDVNSVDVGASSAGDVLGLASDPARLKEFLKQQLAAKTGGGTPIHVENNFNVGEGADRADLEKKLEESKKKALEEYDRRESERARLSFAQ